MSKDTIGYQKLLVQSEHFPMMIPISHQELDGLVGQLMQVCDLIGDQVQRKALKDTIKRICRDWLDTEYTTAGYSKWTGAEPEATIINLEEALRKGISASIKE